MAFPDGIADFRSDTVSRPTPGMRRAMAEAEVGDDAYGEDPTTNALEEECAAALGKDAAVFVPSGSMGNLLAINCLTAPGQEVLCAESAHVRNFEWGAASAVSGVAFRTVPAPGGAITAGEVAAAVAESGRLRPPLGLLVWENTHNVSGGAVVPVDVMEATTPVARAGGLPVHLDGARLWNAVAASGVPAGRYAATADSVMFCFSKGLGAPVGSILCGDAALVAEARRRRKRFGGGMRQAGVLAAAAAVAFRDRERLGEDHARARHLAAGFAARFPEALDPDAFPTNMVLVDEEGLPVPAAAFQEALRAAGVLVGAIRAGVLRFCTHHDIDDEDVARVLAVADQMRAG